VDGAAGKDGAAGAAGKDGAPGLDGAAGKDGVDGAAGKDGAPGKLPTVKAWVERVHYESEVVVHNGATWQALRDTGREPKDTSADWITLAGRGIDGSDGQSLTIKDTFSPTERYNALDVVTLDNRWFVARRDDPGPCPGPGWKAGPGIGRTGKPGERGPQGERGLPGAQGKSASAITGWEIESRNYSASPLLSDGSKGPALDLRELFLRFQEES
jgi:hypothetical protein